jgi:UTP-glucose-1-phosphate uridylyltransferase
LGTRFCTSHEIRAQRDDDRGGYQVLQYVVDEARKRHRAFIFIVTSPLMGALIEDHLVFERGNFKGAAAGIAKEYGLDGGYQRRAQQASPASKSTLGLGHAVCARSEELIGDNVSLPLFRLAR